MLRLVACVTVVAVVVALGAAALRSRSPLTDVGSTPRDRSQQVQTEPHEVPTPVAVVERRAFVGRVVDEQGVAIADARVVLRHPIGSANPGRVWQRETDSDGRFVVDDVPEGRQWVARITHLGFLPREVEAFDPAMHDSPFILHAGVTIRGDVRGALEQRIEHARVCLLDRRYDPPAPLAGDPQSWTTACDSDSGAFQLGPVPAGDYTLAAVAPGFPRLLQDLPTLGPGEHLTGVELRMGLGYILKGRVRGIDGSVMVGVDVTLRQPQQPDAGMVGLLLPQTETRADGTFQIAGLEQGRYEVRFSHFDHTPQVIRWHTDEGDSLQITLEEFGEVKGQVVDDVTGRPIEEFLIFITPLLPDIDLPDHPQGEMLSTFRVTDENGLFQIRELDAGPYEIGVEARGYAPRDIAPIEVDGEVVELRFRLQKGGHVFGQVTDARGVPILGVAVAKDGEGWRSHTRGTRPDEELRPWVNGVELQGRRAAGYSRHRCLTGGSGEFRLGPFGDEEIDVSFTHDEYLATAIRGVTIRANAEIELSDVVLEPATTLVVRAPRESSGESSGDRSWRGGTIRLLDVGSGELISERRLSYRPVEVIHSLPEGAMRLLWQRADGSTIREFEVELDLDRAAEVQLRW